MNKRVDRQVKMQGKIIARTGINIVSCCSCNAVFMHKLKLKSVSCPFCKTRAGAEQFSDLYYEGMPEQKKY